MPFLTLCSMPSGTGDKDAGAGNLCWVVKSFAFQCQRSVVGENEEEITPIYKNS